MWVQRKKEFLHFFLFFFVHKKFQSSFADFRLKSSNVNQKRPIIFDFGDSATRLGSARLDSTHIDYVLPTFHITHRS